LDSRNKIGAPVPDGATVIRGYFDPLLASHAARLTQASRPLAVIVVDPPDPLLPLAARQLLVAALRCVDAVVQDNGIANEDWTDQDLETRHAFVEHVHERSKA
jgi:hypothetical protein